MYHHVTMVPQIPHIIATMVQIGQGEDYFFERTYIGLSPPRSLSNMVYNFISNMYPKQSFIVWPRVRLGVNNFCNILSQVTYH